MALFASLPLVIDSTGTSDSCILIRLTLELCGPRSATLDGNPRSQFVDVLFASRTELRG